MLAIIFSILNRDFNGTVIGNSRQNCRKSEWLQQWCCLNLNFSLW